MVFSGRLQLGTVLKQTKNKQRGSKFTKNIRIKVNASLFQEKTDYGYKKAEISIIANLL